MSKCITQNLSHRRQLEQHIVQIVSCLGALCETHISIYTDTDRVRNGEAVKGKLNAGFDVDPIGEYFQFELELIESEGTQITYHGNEDFHAYYGVSLKLPATIERLFRSAYKNQLFPDVAFPVTGRATLQVEQLDYGTFTSAVRDSFIDFQFDNMTDTRLRDAYPGLLDSLVTLMPWIEYVHSLADQHPDYEYLNDLQEKFSHLIEPALLSGQVLSPTVFKLCEIAGSFEPAINLFTKNNNASFS